VRLVLDASAAVRLVIRTESAGELVEHTSAGSVVAAPSLYGSEVANALWKYVKAGSLELETAVERHDEAIALIDDFTAARELATEALSEGVRYRHPVYDLIYAVLFLVPKLLLGHQSSSKLRFAQRCRKPHHHPHPQAPALPGAQPPASALVSLKPCFLAATMSCRWGHSRSRASKTRAPKPELGRQ